MKKRIYFVLLIGFAMVTLNVEELTAQEKIVIAFGDSLTAERKGVVTYPELIQAEFDKKKINAKVINAGIPGNTSAMAKARFDKDVLDRKPDLVIILLGTNDAAVDVWKDPPATESRVSIDVYEQNMRGFITALKAQGSEIILVTPLPTRWTEKLKGMYGKPPYDPNDPDGFNIILKSYLQRVRDLAASEKVTLIDVYEKFSGYHKVKGQSMDDLFLDGLHPNTKGQSLLAEPILKAIRKMKFGK